MKCISCGNSDEYYLHTVKEMMFGLGEEFIYFECLKCGCLQLVTYPESMEKYYPKNYYSFNKDKGVNLSSRIKFFLTREKRRYSLFKEGYLGRFLNYFFYSLEDNLLNKYGIRKGWTILDIGCGSGYWLLTLKNFGLNLHGIDPFIDNDFEQFSVKIKKGTIHSLSNSTKFHLIRLNHTFEHINDQYETLRKIHGLLTINGICIIAMPVKTDAIWNRYGVNWVQIDAPRHYIIHTITSFRNLAERAGFKIIDITFNSTEFQFLGSEKYLNNISLHSVNSDKISFYRNIFSQKKLNWYRNEAKRLNSESQGDSAIFILKSL